MKTIKMAPKLCEIAQYSNRGNITVTEIAKNRCECNGKTENKSKPLFYVDHALRQ